MKINISQVEAWKNIDLKTKFCDERLKLRRWMVYEVGLNVDNFVVV